MHLNFTYSYLFFGVGRLYSLLGTSKFLIFFDGFSNEFSGKLLQLQGFNFVVFLSSFFSFIFKSLPFGRSLGPTGFILFENDIVKVFSTYFMDFLYKYSINLIAFSMDLTFFNLVFFDPFAFRILYLVFKRGYHFIIMLFNKVFLFMSNFYVYIFLFLRFLVFGFLL